MGHETCGRFGQEIAARKLRHCIYRHRPDLIRLADRPSALQTAHLGRHSPAELESGVSAAEGPLARPGEGPGRRIPAAFYWHPCRNSARVASARGPNLLSAWDNEIRLLMRLALYSPTFRRIPGRYCAYAAAWVSRRTSSSRRDFRRLTVPFAAPEWITLRRWPSSAMRHGSISKLDGSARPAASFSSPLRRASPISTLRSRLTICCCSAANRPACPKRSMPRPMPGC
jgi:hypothetical protein